MSVCARQKEKTGSSAACQRDGRDTRDERGKCDFASGAKVARDRRSDPISDRGDGPPGAGDARAQPWRRSPGRPDRLLKAGAAGFDRAAAADPVASFPTDFGTTFAFFYATLASLAKAKRK